MDAGRELGFEALDFGRDFVGDLDGVAVGLAVDVEQDSGFAVGVDDGVDRLHSGIDVATSPIFTGTPAGVFDDDLSEFFGVCGPGR